MANTWMQRRAKPLTVFHPLMIARLPKLRLVTWVNDSIYGLQANVWTRDVSRVHKMARALKAGTIAVNSVWGSDITTPFGGYKQSGIGRDKSLHAMDKYQQLKHTFIQL